MPAGNGNQDICSTPIGQSNAVIVGASTLSDEIAYFSNYGSCTTLFAPGLNIQSTYVGSETSISVLSGTEMAAAHVAGLLAYLQSLQPELLAPADLKSLLLNYATKGVFSSLPTEDTPNVSRNKLKSQVTRPRLQLTNPSCLPTTTSRESETRGVTRKSGFLSV